MKKTMLILMFLSVALCGFPAEYNNPYDPGALRIDGSKTGTSLTLSEKVKAAWAEITGNIYASGTLRIDGASSFGGKVLIATSTDAGAFALQVAGNALITGDQTTAKAGVAEQLITKAVTFTVAAGSTATYTFAAGSTAKTFVDGDIALVGSDGNEADGRYSEYRFAFGIGIGNNVSTAPVLTNIVSGSAAGGTTYSATIAAVGAGNQFRVVITNTSASTWRPKVLRMRLLSNLPITIVSEP